MTASSRDGKKEQIRIRERVGERHIRWRWVDADSDEAKAFLRKKSEVREVAPSPVRSLNQSPTQRLAQPVVLPDEAKMLHVSRATRSVSPRDTGEEKKIQNTVDAIDQELKRLTGERDDASREMDRYTDISWENIKEDVKAALKNITDKIGAAFTLQGAVEQLVSPSILGMASLINSARGALAEAMGPEDQRLKEYIKHAEAHAKAWNQITVLSAFKRELLACIGWVPGKANTEFEDLAQFPFTPRQLGEAMAVIDHYKNEKVFKDTEALRNLEPFITAMKSLAEKHKRDPNYEIAYSSRKAKYEKRKKTTERYNKLADKVRREEEAAEQKDRDAKLPEAQIQENIKKRLRARQEAKRAERLASSSAPAVRKRQEERKIRQAERKAAAARPPSTTSPERKAAEVKAPIEVERKKADTFLAGIPAPLTKSLKELGPIDFSAVRSRVSPEDQKEIDDFTRENESLLSALNQAFVSLSSEEERVLPAFEFLVESKGKIAAGQIYADVGELQKNLRDENFVEKLFLTDVYLREQDRVAKQLAEFKALSARPVGERKAGDEDRIRILKAANAVDLEKMRGLQSAVDILKTPDADAKQIAEAKAKMVELKIVQEGDESQQELRNKLEDLKKDFDLSGPKFLTHSFDYLFNAYETIVNAKESLKNLMEDLPPSARGVLEDRYAALDSLEQELINAMQARLKAMVESGSYRYEDATVFHRNKFDAARGKEAKAQQFPNEKINALTLNKVKQCIEEHYKRAKKEYPDTDPRRQGADRVLQELHSLPMYRPAPELNEPRLGGIEKNPVVLFVFNSSKDRPEKIPRTYADFIEFRKLIRIAQSEVNQVSKDNFLANPDALFRVVKKLDAIETEYEEALIRILQKDAKKQSDAFLRRLEAGEITSGNFEKEIKEFEKIMDTARVQINHLSDAAPDRYVKEVDFLDHYLTKISQSTGEARARLIAHADGIIKRFGLADIITPENKSEIDGKVKEIILKNLKSSSFSKESCMRAIQELRDSYRPVVNLLERARADVSRANAVPMEDLKLVEVSSLPGLKIPAALQEVFKPDPKNPIKKRGEFAKKKQSIFEKMQDFSAYVQMQKENLEQNKWEVKFGTDTARITNTLAEYKALLEAERNEAVARHKELSEQWFSDLRSGESKRMLDKWIIAINTALDEIEGVKHGLESKLSIDDAKKYVLSNAANPIFDFEKARRVWDIINKNNLPIKDDFKKFCNDTLSALCIPIFNVGQEVGSKEIDKAFEAIEFLRLISPDGEGLKNIRKKADEYIDKYNGENIAYAPLLAELVTPEKYFDFCEKRIDKLIREFANVDVEDEREIKLDWRGDIGIYEYKKKVTGYLGNSENFARDASLFFSAINSPPAPADGRARVNAIIHAARWNEVIAAHVEAKMTSDDVDKYRLKRIAELFNMKAIGVGREGELNVLRRIIMKGSPELEDNEWMSGSEGEKKLNELLEQEADKPWSEAREYLIGKLAPPELRDELLQQMRFRYLKDLLNPDLISADNENHVFFKKIKELSEEPVQEEGKPNRPPTAAEVYERLENFVGADNVDELVAAIKNFYTQSEQAEFAKQENRPLDIVSMSEALAQKAKEEKEGRRSKDAPSPMEEALNPHLAVGERSRAYEARAGNVAAPLWAILSEIPDYKPILSGFSTEQKSQEIHARNDMNALTKELFNSVNTDLTTAMIWLEGRDAIYLETKESRMRRVDAQRLDQIERLETRIRELERERDTKIPDLKGLSESKLREELKTIENSLPSELLIFIDEPLEPGRTITPEQRDLIARARLIEAALAFNQRIDFIARMRDRLKNVEVKSADRPFEFSFQDHPAVFFSHYKLPALQVFEQFFKNNKNNMIELQKLVSSEMLTFPESDDKNPFLNSLYAKLKTQGISNPENFVKKLRELSDPGDRDAYLNGLLREAKTPQQQEALNALKLYVDFEGQAKQLKLDISQQIVNLALGNMKELVVSKDAESKLAEDQQLIQFGQQLGLLGMRLQTVLEKNAGHEFKIPESVKEKWLQELIFASNSTEKRLRYVAVKQTSSQGVPINMKYVEECVAALTSSGEGVLQAATSI